MLSPTRWSELGWVRPGLCVREPTPARSVAARLHEPILPTWTRRQPVQSPPPGSCTELGFCDTTAMAYVRQRTTRTETVSTALQDWSDAMQPFKDEADAAIRALTNGGKLPRRED